ncbi:MAG: hypothetical protein HW421_1916 [Ignavibacteria bacterium]|nr:hypothetical protein [Ignavibacteria bacterium]
MLLKNKLLLLLFLLISASNLSCQSFGGAKKFLDEAKKLTKSDKLTESDAVSGIKEALTQGISKGTDIVSRMDGYFKNPEIKIPFPPEAKKVEKSLRDIGMGSEVDKVVVTLNRAAETAATEAKPIFVSAIKQMTVTDAIGIVKGNDGAATDYLRRTTSVLLADKFRPVISSSLDKVDATKYWKSVMTTYNKIPFVDKVNPDLTEYVLGKALEGLFHMIAKEETNIRKDPVARTTELLKKVFGGNF